MDDVKILSDLHALYYTISRRQMEVDDLQNQVEELVRVMIAYVESKR